MSKQVPSNAVPEPSATLETGLEAFRSSEAFRGPVEDIDGHDCNDHFAHIYETSEEKFEAAVPFVRHGLERGDRVMYVVDESTEDEVRAALRDGGVDVDAALESGALTFPTVQETYLRDGSFDVEEMIDFYGDTVAEATEEFEALRIVAEMTWIPDDETSLEQFIEYEQKINRLFDQTESLAICQYNRDRFDPAAIRNVVQAHPHLIYDGAACHNVYYTPPEEFFGDDAPAREVDRMLGTLRDRTVAKAAVTDHRRFLRELHEITASQDRSFEEKIHALLDLGCERLAIDFGFLNRVDAASDRLVIEYASDEHEHYGVGDELPLSETFCQAATDIKEAVAVSNPPEEGFDDLHVYEEFGVDGYLGTYIPVDGGTDRTLAFVPEETPEAGFSEQAKTYLELMGQWIGYELNRRQREQFVRECYEITSDPGLDFEAKLERLLDIARGRMGLDAAGLTHLPEWDGKFRNEYTVGYGDDADGEQWTDPGEGCYCRQVIAEDEPIGKADVRGTEWEDDEIYQEQGLTCYLGTKVTSGSRPYGTLWVGSTEPRDREFSETERTLFELLGQWVSYEIERRERSDAQQTLYEIAAAPDLEFEEKLDALFDLGADQFGLDVGGMAAVYPEADKLEVEHVSEECGDVAPGHEAPLSGTYCGAAYGADGPATVTDPVASGYGDTYSHDELGFEAYLGTHIEIDGDDDRLFFFTTSEPRDEAFSDAEKTFIELLGQWVKYELERRQRERELRERTEHLTALVETTPECIKTVAEDGTLLQMNPAGLDMVEADAESDVIGACVYDLIAPEHREQFREFNERICRGERGTLEFDIVGLDGTRRHMESHAAPLRRPDGTTVQVALTRDVTEQKEREQALQEERDLVERIIETSPTGIATLDADGTFDRANDRTTEILGYTPDEIGSYERRVEQLDPITPDRERLDPNDIPTYRVFENGEAVHDVEVGLQRPDGDRVWVSVSGTPMRDGGEVTTAVITFADITDRLEYERKLEESNERLEQFAYAASHDLQEPLRMVTSYLQLLAERYDDALDEDGEEFLEYAVDGAERMREMIDGLLEYSRVETRGEPFEPVELDAVLDDVVEDLQLEIEETDAEITTERLPRVEGDDSQLRQVFQNLLDNAITYSGDEPPAIRVAAERRGAEWVISVHDDGIGIDSDDQDRIFTVFDRLHSREEYEGTGLGLALCQRIVERHGGGIWVDSEPGEGSTFSLTLPASRQ